MPPASVVWHMMLTQLTLAKIVAALYVRGMALRTCMLLCGEHDEITVLLCVTL